MSSPRVILALDRTADRIRAVRVRTDTARPEVCDAAEFPASTPIPAEFAECDSILTAVPDNRTVVKYLFLPGQTADPVDRARFELTASLTGAESDYLTDIIFTGLDGLYLGIAARAEAIERPDISSDSPGNPLPTPLKTAVRSVALAHGYLAYCTPAASGLVILLDLTPGFCSVALIHNRHLVGLAGLPLHTLDLTLAPHRERFAIELKTLIDFRLSTIFAHGLTLPPAALVVSSPPASDDLLTLLHRYFSLPVTAPDINAGFLGERLRSDPDHLRRFLVPLGLTAYSLAK